MIGLGQPAPWFRARSPVNANFAFSSLGGRYLLMAFLPADPERAMEMQAWARRHRSLFDDASILLLLVTRDPAVFATAANTSGVVWFLDPDGAISRGYGALAEDGAERGMWVLIDPSMRVMACAEGASGDAPMFQSVTALPAPDDHAGAPLWAPVLIAPRIFEPELCRRLIALYDAQGGEVSGVMREIDGRTVPVLDNSKRRRDAQIDDPDLRAMLRHRLERRLLPEIRKAFQFEATRLERYIVACYDAEEGGWFNPHRDNTTKGTAHRRFACSINLNAEDFEGGDLRFPEYGSRLYRPPTGGAVVFSCSLLHQATPVTRGRRYAFLPFFYDVAGEQLREANAALVDLAPARA